MSSEEKIMEIQAQAATDIGRKKRSNEDSFSIDASIRLYIVADGMGGHAAGEVASSVAVEQVNRIIYNGTQSITDWQSEEARYQILDLIEVAVRQAGREIYNMAELDLSKRGMGTTVSLLLLTPFRGYIAHVGDSRIYLVRDEEVFQLTEDHSLIRELLRNKKITPEEAANSPYRNALTRAVGVYADVEVDLLDFEIAEKDQFLLCSDGLSNYLQTQEEILSTLQETPFEAVPRRFIDLANSRGGKDNITSVLVKINTKGQADGDIAFRLNILREMPIFQHLEYVELIEVLNVSIQRRYEANVEIFAEGIEGDEMFVILEGHVSIRKGGKEVITLAQGGHFGEMALMDRNVRSASAIALESTRVISVQRRPLFHLMQQNKEIAVKLLWCFMQVLNQRLRFTTEDLERVRSTHHMTKVFDLD
jgi:serine/threonine protein phosphatase PrpC